MILFTAFARTEDGRRSDDEGEPIPPPSLSSVGCIHRPILHLNARLGRRLEEALPLPLPTDISSSAASIPQNERPFSSLRKNFVICLGQIHPLIQHPSRLSLAHALHLSSLSSGLARMHATSRPQRFNILHCTECVRLGESPASLNSSDSIPHHVRRCVFDTSRTLSQPTEMFLR